jgi:hypothetical protein
VRLARLDDLGRLTVSTFGGLFAALARCQQGTCGMTGQGRF